MLYLWAINLIPVALIVAAWFCHYTRPVTLSKSRRTLFGCGLVTSAFGTMLLISFLGVNFADPSHVGHLNVWGGRLLMTGFLVAILSLLLSFTGKGLQRVLSASSCATLIVLLYIGGLATSI
jgi:hypothetical protein